MTKFIIMGYYLKVSKLEISKPYKFKCCRLCNKELFGSSICNIHNVKLVETIENIAEKYSIFDLDYNDKFKQYCDMNNITIKKDFDDLIISVLDSDNSEIIICKTCNVEIVLDLNDVLGVIGIPKFDLNLALQVYNPIKKFLELQGHDVEMNCNIVSSYK